MAEITITNLPKLIKMAEQYPAVAEKHIGKAIARSLARILGAEKTNAPFGVTGNLRDNWSINIGRFSGVLKSNVPYAVGVEEGTAPHYVSPTKIKSWAEARGLNAYAVANSIAKKGTKANPFFQRSIDDAKSGVEKDFENAFKNLVDDIPVN